MTTRVAIQGVCDPRFQGVKEAFAQNFADHGEVGAAVAVVVGGRTVVDLWGGHADAALSRPWQQDTIVNVFSTTKGMTAICAHRLADQGILDIEAPVAKYWPEFAQAGKGELPVRYLLSHRAGLPAVRAMLPPGSAYDWERMTSVLMGLSQGEPKRGLWAGQKCPAEWRPTRPARTEMSVPRALGSRSCAGPHRSIESPEPHQHQDGHCRQHQFSVRTPPDGRRHLAGRERRPKPSWPTWVDSNRRSYRRPAARADYLKPL